MDSQQIQVLETFLNQLVQARGITKDPQADGLIARAVAQQPDASYLLVQRALLVERALDTAKAQIASLQEQLQAAQPPARGFLDAESWGNAPQNVYRPGAPAPAAPAYYQPQPQQQSQPQPLQAQASAPSPGFFSGGMKGALGTVAATAAGVAGGAFLFQGIEHMMHPGGGSGFMNQSGSNAFSPPVENTTVNNYYETDTPTSSGGDSGLDFLSSADMNVDDDSSLI